MKYARLGGIANTQGLKGVLKIKSDTDFKEVRYKVGNILYIDFNNKMIPVTVESFRQAKGLDYVSFIGMNDINLVEKYKGSQIYFEDNISISLKEDEFRYSDLVGMSVVYEDVIGDISEVRDYPQGEMLVVPREGLKNVLVPFRKEFVKEVNTSERIVYIQNMEGLLWWK